MTAGRHARRLIGASVALAACLALPASASAVTFGTDLSRVPTNTVSCDQVLLPFYAIPTCSTTSADIATGEQLRPPVGRGVVTGVRVRVGPTTGPMQVVVQEAIRTVNPVSPGNPGYVCCKAISFSQVFTPAANATTSVRVNLPIRQDLAPDPVSNAYFDQHLALSVLAAGVPIPAAVSANSGYSIFFPAWQQVGEERTGPYGGIGAAVTMSADWQSCSKGGAASAAKKKKKKKRKSPCGKRKKKKRKKK